MRRNILRPLLGIALIGTSLSVASCNNSSDANQNTLVIGLECNYAPFNWTLAESNINTLPISNYANQYADGYDINFAKRASQELGMEVKIVKMEWDNLIPQLNASEINCIIAGMTDTEERRLSIDFTDEYYRSELVLVTKKNVADQYSGQTLNNEQLQTLLNGKGLESQLQTVTNDILETFVSNYNAIQLTAVDTFATAAADVSAGSAFAMSAEYPVAQAIVQSNSDLGIIHISQDVLGIDLSELGVSIGVRKGDTELARKLNSVLANYTQEERNQDMANAVSRSGE